jgi:hypothetical protein
MGDIAVATGRTAVAVPAPAGTTVAVMAPPGPMEAARNAYQHTLEAKVRYARLLADSGLLPRAYLHNPANVLFALEYGETLGITPIAAMLGIHVIDGKPCASSGLISGLVRRAGHKLRVRGDAVSATCVIIRSDDPEYKFEFTWNMDRAKTAGLTSKQVWRNYPAAMLMARAITEAARAACQDVLFGLAYTPEELGADALDDDYALEDYAPATTTAPSKTAPVDAASPEVADEPVDSGDMPAARDTLRQLSDRLDELKCGDKLAAVSVLAGREHLTSAADLTQDEADTILAGLAGCEDPEDFIKLMKEQEV